MKIFNSKGYDKWDLLAGGVPIEDNPQNLILSKNGFSEGDSVIFFVEKKREGVIKKGYKG